MAPKDFEIGLEMETLIECEEEVLGLSKHVVDLEHLGPIDVFVEGDLDKLRDSSNVFLTIHNVGSSYKSWVKFTKHEDMVGVRRKSLILHISLYGQSEEAEDLTNDFPSIEDLGLHLVSVLDQLRISRVVLLGDGAGANIALRFALCHPSRVHGVVLLNVSAEAGTNNLMGQLQRKLSKSTPNNTGLNLKNVSKYEESYKKRGEIINQLSSDISIDCMLLTGIQSKSVKDCEAIHREVKTGLASIIKVENVGENLLDEAKDKIADAVILFCQGLGLIPSVKRKLSRQLSTSSTGSSIPPVTRKLSMEHFDIPNIRRLSLTTHNL